MISYETIHTIRELVETAGMEYKKDIVLKYIADEHIKEESFGEFAAQCQSLTAWIACKSKENGRPVRVAMMGANSPLYVKLFMGVMCGGGIAIPMDPQMKEPTICGCLRKAEADIYVYDQSIKADSLEIKKQVPTLKETLKMEQIPQIIAQYANNTEQIPVTSADCATIIFTSGTTGEEKGVMLSNGNLIDNIFCTKQAKKNVKVSILPMHHSFCITGDILMCFANCATLCINGDASKVVENLVLFEPNIVNMVPMIAQALYNRLLQTAKASGKSPIEVKPLIFGKRIEKIVAGGAHLPAELVEKYQKLGIFLCQGYGMTECSPSISSPDLYRKDKAHTAGKVVFRCKTRVVDGELQVKSPSVMMGYVNAPELTAQAITEDGWLRTGDIGYEDEEGFLYIMGRKKNLIILSNGNNVSPEQLEKLLLDHQIINQALVYGENNHIVAEIYPDPVCLKTLSVSELQQQISTIIEQINATLPFYKQIMKHIIRKTPMQMTASGKIIRAQRAGTDDMITKETYTMQMPQNMLQQKLWDILADALGHTDFGIDTDIFDAGIDSLGCVNTLAAFAEQLDFHLELDKLLTLRTILQIEQEYIQRCSEKKTDYEKRTIYPLNNVQKYFAYLLKGNTTSNVPVLFKLGDDVDLSRLTDAIKGLFQVHPVLNNVVQMYETKGYANFRNDEKIPDIPVYQLSCEQWEKQKNALIRPYLYTPDEALYHIEIYQVEKEKYLFIDIAHIISDGVSLGILVRDINRLYAGEQVKPESYTFYEYLLDCEKMRENHTTDKFYQYFMDLFHDAEIDRTILNRSDKQDLSVSDEAILNGRFEALHADAVKAFCKQHNVSENTLFLTAFSYCVSVFHNQDKIVTTSVNHGRNDSRFSKIVGCLFKTYNYRYTYHNGQNVLDMLHESQKQLLETFSRHLDNYHADEMFFQYQGDILGFDEVAGSAAQIISLPMNALPFHLSVLEGKHCFVYELRYWKNRYEETMLKLFLSIYEHTVMQIVRGGDIHDMNTYLPKEAFPAHALQNTEALAQSVDENLLKNGTDNIYILDRYGKKQPYGAWGTLYINHISSGQTARIMPNNKIDFLEDNGRVVMIEGLTGRHFCDLAQLEKQLSTYPDVKSVRCYVKMADKLIWSVYARLTCKKAIDEAALKTYLEQTGQPFIMPILIQDIERD